MKTLFALALLAPSLATAGQLQFNRDEKPVCYHGNPKSALQELLNIDYDPALSNGRTFRGSRDGAILIYAEQIDENGWLQEKFILAPCRR